MNSRAHRRWRRTFNALAQGLIWLGSDGAIRHINRPAAHCTGWGRADRLPDGEALRAVRQVVLAREQQRVQLPLQRADGSGSPPTDCRLMPGPLGDDALLLIDAPPQEAQASLAQGLLDERAQLLAAVARLSQLNLPAPAERADDPRGEPDEVVDLAALLRDLWTRLGAGTPPLRLTLESDRARAGAPAPQTALLRTPQPQALRQLLSECLAAAVRARRPGQPQAAPRLQLQPCPAGAAADCRAAAPAGWRIVIADDGLREPLDGPGRHAVRERLAWQLCQGLARPLGAQLGLDRAADGRQQRVLWLPCTATRPQAAPCGARGLPVPAWPAAANAGTLALHEAGADR